MHVWRNQLGFWCWCYHLSCPRLPLGHYLLGYAFWSLGTRSPYISVSKGLERMSRGVQAYWLSCCLIIMCNCWHGSSIWCECKTCECDQGSAEILIHMSAHPWRPEVLVPKGNHPRWPRSRTQKIHKCWLSKRASCRPYPFRSLSSFVDCVCAHVRFQSLCAGQWVYIGNNKVRLWDARKCGWS